MLAGRDGRCVEKSQGLRGKRWEWFGRHIVLVGLAVLLFHDKRHRGHSSTSGNPRRQFREMCEYFLRNLYISFRLEPCWFFSLKTWGEGRRGRYCPNIEKCPHGSAAVPNSSRLGFIESCERLFFSINARIICNTGITYCLGWKFDCSDSNIKDKALNSGLISTFV